MTSQPPVRFWIEIILGAATAIMLVASLIWPDWIERISGMAPDGGDGSAEWGGTAVLAGLTVLFFADAGRMWWRTAHAA